MFLHGALVALTAVACSDPVAKAPAQRHDAGRRARVFEPPPGDVRPVPPFAIRSDGVGPYLIGSSLSEVLDTVPRGPRIELFEIEGVAEFNLVRADDEGLVIGGDRSKVAFVAALAPKLAQTASGIGVGSTAAELAKALDGPVMAPHRATDPRVREFDALPGVRFVLDRDRVVAVIVSSRPADADPDDPKISECRKGGALAEAVEAVFGAARVDKPKTAAVRFGCFAGEAPEALVVAGGRLTVVGGSADKPRRIASQRAAEVSFAAPIDVDGDGRDEIVAVYVQAREGARVARVELLRVEGGKLVVLQGQDAYEVSPRGAAWTGAHIEEVDLLIEVVAQGRKLIISGLYLHRVKGRTREVAPLIPRTMRLPKPKPKPAGKKDPPPPAKEKAKPAVEKPPE